MTASRKLLAVTGERRRFEIVLVEGADGRGYIEILEMASPGSGAASRWLATFPITKVGARVLGSALFGWGSDHGKEG